MLRVVLDTEDSTLVLRVDEAYGDEIRVPVEMAPVGNGEGFVVDWVLDGTPDVDETNAASKKAESFLAKMVVYALYGRIKCLVNMDIFLQSGIFSCNPQKIDVTELTAGPRMTMPSLDLSSGLALRRPLLKRR